MPPRKRKQEQKKVAEQKGLNPGLGVSPYTGPAFVNESQPGCGDWQERPNSYKYDRPSKYLFLWSRLFQTIVSQAGTYLLTQKFHTAHCAIHKCEGGCNISGVGELVLGRAVCYWDYRQDEKGMAQLTALAALITDIVLKWDPMDPVASMIKATVDHINQIDAKAAFRVGTNEPPLSEKVLRDALEKSDNGGAFGGDALSSFFDWNPFSSSPIDRDYQRFCLTQFSGKTHEEVDQKYADEDLGKDLLAQLKQACIERNKGRYAVTPLCCSPSRIRDGELRFWINTGRTTQIDGWKTEKEIRGFLNSKEPLKDRATW